MSFGYQILGFGSGGAGAPYMEATGGTVVTYTDTINYKAHYYEATGSFVAVIGTEDVGNKVDYFVTGAGGSGGQHIGGGGGGGGSVTAGSLTTAITSGSTKY